MQVPQQLCGGHKQADALQAGPLPLTHGSASFCRYDRGSNMRTGRLTFSRSRLPASRFLPSDLITSTMALQRAGGGGDEGQPEGDIALAVHPLSCSQATTHH